VSGFVAPDPIKHVPTAAKFVIRALKAMRGVLNLDRLEV